MDLPKSFSSVDRDQRPQGGGWGEGKGGGEEEKNSLLRNSFFVPLQRFLPSVFYGSIHWWTKVSIVKVHKNSTPVLLQQRQNQVRYGGSFLAAYSNFLSIVKRVGSVALWMSNTNNNLFQTAAKIQMLEPVLLKFTWFWHCCGTTEVLFWSDRALGLPAL